VGVWCGAVAGLVKLLGLLSKNNKNLWTGVSRTMTYARIMANADGSLKLEKCCLVDKAFVILRRREAKNKA
jgi:hypothetical protein